MHVNPDSPVKEKESFLYQWDKTARKYFNHFEVHKHDAKNGLQMLHQNILTRNRDPILFYHRYKDIDSIVYRQLLGDISKDEVRELNRVFCSSTRLLFTKGYY